MLTSRQQDNHNDSDGDEEEKQEPTEVLRMLRSSYLVRQLTRASNDIDDHVYVLDLGQRRRAVRQADNDSSQDVLMNSSSDDNDSETNAERVRSRSTRYEIECDPMLPKEWKEIEEEESTAALLLFDQMGSLAVLIYKRVSELEVMEDGKEGSKKEDSL